MTDYMIVQSTKGTGATHVYGPYTDDETTALADAQHIRERLANSEPIVVRVVATEEVPT